MDVHRLVPVLPIFLFIELFQIGVVLGCAQVSSCSSYLPISIELLQIGAVLGCTQVSSCSSYLHVPIELLQIGAVLGCTQVSSCSSYLPVSIELLQIGLGPTFVFLFHNVLSLILIYFFYLFRQT